MNKPQPRTVLLSSPPSVMMGATMRPQKNSPFTSSPPVHTNNENTNIMNITNPFNNHIFNSFPFPNCTSFGGYYQPTHLQPPFHPGKPQSPPTIQLMPPILPIQSIQSTKQVSIQKQPPKPEQSKKSPVCTPTKSKISAQSLSKSLLREERFNNSIKFEMYTLTKPLKENDINIETLTEESRYVYEEMLSREQGSFNYSNPIFDIETNIEESCITKKCFKFKFKPELADILYYGKPYSDSVFAFVYNKTTDVFKTFKTGPILYENLVRADFINVSKLKFNN
jgi:hypothetical protein